MTTRINRINKLADRLGQISAEIADLQAEYEKVRQQLIDSGQSEVEGRLFRVTITPTTRTTVSWRDLVERLEVPPRKLASLMKRFSKVTESVTVKVFSR